MPLLLSQNRCTPLSCDARHNKGDLKGIFGLLRGKGHAVTASALFGSPSTTSNPISYRSTAISSHHETAADGSSLNATAADAASSPTSASNDDWEAVRLMTAARILSSPSSTDDATLSLDDDSSVLSAAMLEQQDGTDLGVDPLGPLALLDDIQTLDADSLALAVGILRQHQPVDAAEEGVQLSERLRDFLMVLRKRPATSAAGPSAATAIANGFWAGGDDWSDVRTALMDIGIDASLDEEDDEDVWALEAGRVKTRRTRLLRSLPKLDSSTAQQLTAFLAEVQQRTPAGHSSTITASTAAAPAGNGAVAVSEEEQQWWQQASLAYSLLKHQAGAVQQQQPDAAELQ